MKRHKRFLKGLANLVQNLRTPPTEQITVGFWRGLFESKRKKAMREHVNHLNSMYFQKWRNKIVFRIMLISVCWFFCMIASHRLLLDGKKDLAVVSALLATIACLVTLAFISHRNPRPETLKLSDLKRASKVSRGVGVLGGAATGAYLGSGIGLALGPLGAIAGTIPGAILGAALGYLCGTRIDHL